MSCAPHVDEHSTLLVIRIHRHPPYYLLTVLYDSPSVDQCPLSIRKATQQRRADMGQEQRLIVTPAGLGRHSVRHPRHSTPHTRQWKGRACRALLGCERGIGRGGGARRSRQTAESDRAIPYRRLIVALWMPAVGMCVCTYMYVSVLCISHCVHSALLSLKESEGDGQ